MAIGRSGGGGGRRRAPPAGEREGGRVEGAGGAVGDEGACLGSSHLSWRGEWRRRKWICGGGGGGGGPDEVAELAGEEGEEGEGGRWWLGGKHGGDR